MICCRLAPPKILSLFFLRPTLHRRGGGRGQQISPSHLLVKSDGATGCRCRCRCAPHPANLNANLMSRKENQMGKTRRARAWRSGMAGLVSGASM